MKIIQYILMIMLVSMVSLEASDLEKEKRWAEQVEDSLLDGEVVWLKDGGHKVFSLYTLAESAIKEDIEDAKKSVKKPAVIILHGSGAHPDWPQVINPLRVGLPESGWSVLSIQLPVLANDVKHDAYRALLPEVPSRIEAGISYLKGEGFDNVIIIGHSLGTEMASYFLAKSKVKVTGYVGIGMPASNVEYLADINLPILDLYGSEDLKSVMGSANDRAKASAANQYYLQNQVEKADHFFDGKEDELLEVVLKWLDKYAQNS